MEHNLIKEMFSWQFTESYKGYVHLNIENTPLDDHCHECELLSLKKMLVNI